MSDSPIQTRLPENAYRELKPGEVYTPMVPAGANVPEVTMRSIIFGIVMNIIFSMAATYLALKVGQGIETAIPISILAVGFSGAMLQAGKRVSSILENVNILAISTTSGIVAGGTVFTMPAIYILKLNNKLDISNTALFFQIFLIPLFGAALGAIFLIPFRRYFVKDMHGKLPFPEGTATNEILVTGSATESKGQAFTLVFWCLIGALYNWLCLAMKLFSETFTTALIPACNKLTNQVKAVFFLGTGAELLGLGFIIGLRYATIICCGSFLSWFVIIPLLNNFDLTQLKVLNTAIVSTDAGSIFRAIPRNIGIGGIFAAGLISIVKMSGVIVTALRQALGGLISSKSSNGAADRTDEDISYPMLLLLGTLVTIAMGLYFRFAVLAGMPGATRLAIISVVLALAVAFLFTTVSAWAIAMISVTPISGMTVTTIIITAVVLVNAGLPRGNAGMLATLMVGGVVAAALSMAGTLVTEFKIGYWMGASPKKIQYSSIIASILASAVVTGTIMFLAHTKGYDPTISDKALAAPQANVMASALESFVGGGSVPWTLYGVGAVIALIMTMLGISGLAFALGMYLPMELNTPILVGALVAAAITRGTTDEKLKKGRNDKGILIASGLIAGGAIIGVVISMLTAANDEFFKNYNFMAKIDISQWLTRSGYSADDVAQTMNWLGLTLFALLCLVSYVDARRAKSSDSIAPTVHH